MITLSVQINLLPEEFSIDRCDFIEITLPEIPRIGDQLMLKKVMEAIELWKVAYEAKDLDMLPRNKALTYVTNIVYGDNDVIYIGLSYNPKAFMFTICDLEVSEKIYWTVLHNLPKIGDQIMFDEDFPHERRTRYINDIIWDVGAMGYGMVFTTEQRDVPIVDINKVNSDINTKVVNTVSTDTYINNNSLDVEVVNSRTIDVNVKKFDHSYIYVKEY